MSKLVQKFATRYYAGTTINYYVSDEGRGGGRPNYYAWLQGGGGLLNGHAVQLLLKLYQSIVVKNPKPENLSPSVLLFIHNMEEWLSGPVASDVGFD